MTQTWKAQVPILPFSQAKTWKVVASAGTGKTYTVERCIFELLDSGVKPDEIMYLIYNKTPAKEFQRKLIDKGISLKDMPWIGTHHSRCLRMLGLSGKNVVNLKKLGDDLGLDFSEGGQMMKIKQDLDLKIYAGDTNYDSLELKLLEILHAEEAKDKWDHARYMAHALSLRIIPTKVKYIFVDEAQDSTKIQWDYYEHLKESPQVKGLMLVGDDKQAINAWTGGRGDLFLGFKADEQVCLGKTYRNGKNILSAANSIAEKIEERSPLTKESAQTIHGEVMYIPYIHDCANMILESLKNDEHIMILCRNQIYVQMAKSVLEDEGVPIASVSRNDVIDVFKAMRALATKEAPDMTLSDILAVFAPDKLKTKGYIKNMAKFKKGEYEGMVAAEYALMSYGERWSGDLSLFGFTRKFAEDVMATLDGKLPRDVWSGISDDIVLEVEQSIRTLGVDHKSVEIKTVHSVKGLECDTVILVRNIVGIVRDNENTNPDDESRCWYVAVTRARFKVVFTEIYQERRIVTGII